MELGEELSPMNLYSNTFSQVPIAFYQNIYLMESRLLHSFIMELDIYILTTPLERNDKDEKQKLLGI